MAKKKTPQQLREEAQRLMEQAKAEEQARHQEIGKAFVAFMENKFEKFSLEAFKVEAARIWRG